MQLLGIIGGIYKLLDLIFVFFLRLVGSEEVPSEVDSLIELPSITRNPDHPPESVTSERHRKIEVLEIDHGRGDEI